ncbi:type II secretion system F family protein [Candidatus Woesearchaeota archaeon]|nr:type II secretion system F family protein [Candidatus Woesearchaeota archaeon]
MEFFNRMAKKYPELKRKLYVAGINKTPKQFVAQNFKSSVMLTLILTIGIGMFAIGFGMNIYMVPLLYFIFFFPVFSLLMRVVDVEIAKFAKEIDRDVLFAGRFLLIKLNSGRPLINAIVDASNSYGVASKYFREMVKDIELGTPLEDALQKASRYCPSKKMQRILFQISNALSIGVDVTDYLEAILDEIAADQLLEIQKYGRKLSGITMFYMLFAVIVPSLGITMGITVASLVSIQVSFGLFLVVLFFLTLIELGFITIFRQIRPNVNI